MKALLLARYAVLGSVLYGASAILGFARFVATEPTSPADYIQGGVAVSAIAFAGAVVKFMGGLLDKERARGDRLESSLVEKAIPAIASAASAMQSLQSTVTALAPRRGD